MQHYLKCDKSLITIPIMKCEYCPKEFVRNYDRKKHLLIHTKDKPFKCNFCDYSTADDTNLRNHIKRHNYVSPHECSECRKRFSTQDDLYAHKIECLTIERPFVCKTCKYKFKTKRALLVHQECHGEAKYECDICRKKFKKKQLLTNHKKTHDKIPRYKCNFCDYRSHFKDAIKRHASSKHKAEVKQKLQLISE